MRLAAMADRALAIHPFLQLPATRQLLRYIVAGLFVTQITTLIYSLLVTAGLAALVANVGSTACGVCLSYTVHSRWSFRGGQKDSETLQLGRFLAATGVAFAINNLWIWLLVHHFGLSPYAPIPLMMVATPVLSFLLNRYWVFRAH